MLLSTMMAVLGRRRSLLPFRTARTAISSMARNQMGNVQVLRECFDFYAQKIDIYIQRHNDLTYHYNYYSIKVNKGSFTATVNAHSAIAIYTGAKL